jgi:hypothetical protein
MDNPETLVRLFSSCVLCTRCYQCLWIVHSWLPLRYFLTLIFVLCLVYPVLPVVLDCPFLISPCEIKNGQSRDTGNTGYTRHRAKINVRKYVRGNQEWTNQRHWQHRLQCLWIAPSVFSNVYFRPVSCVPGVTSVSGLSILDFPFGTL